jgi:hypothetical protein
VFGLGAGRSKEKGVKKRLSVHRHSSFSLSLCAKKIVAQREREKSKEWNRKPPLTPLPF